MNRFQNSIGRNITRQLKTSVQRRTPFAETSVRLKSTKQREGMLARTFPAALLTIWRASGDPHQQLSAPVALTHVALPWEKILFPARIPIPVRLLPAKSVSSAPGKVRARIPSLCFADFKRTLASANGVRRRRKSRYR